MLQRTVSALVAGVLFLLILLQGGYLYGAAMILLAILAYREFLAMNRLSAGQAGFWAGLAGMLAFAVPWEAVFHIRSKALQPEPLVWYLLFILLLLTVVSKNRFTHKDASMAFLGAVYIGAGFHYMWSTRLAEHGWFWSLLIFIGIWASDTGAYLTGRLIGRTKLWPAISPHKTVEGAVGAILFSIAAALVFAWVHPEWLAFGRAAALGFWISLAGQAGDLIESAYKRVAGVKDSGAILPGHGGALDRMDSWIIVFAFVHLTFLV